MEKSYDWLKKFNKSVTLATEAVIIVLMAIMAVVTIAQVFMRYVMHSPIRWSEELARYLMVWVAFFGASLGIKAGTHFGLEVFLKYFSPKVQQIISLMTKLLLIFFLIVVLKEGIALSCALAFQRSPAMRISMFWPYFSVPVGALLMIIQLVSLIPDDLESLSLAHSEKEADKGWS